MAIRSRWGLVELDQGLAEHHGTVTEFLEALTGEPVIADVLHQAPVTAKSDNVLGVADGQAVTHRAAVLKGLTTGNAYVYAESLFVPERLPAVVVSRLEDTDDPIGRILVDNGMNMKRERLPKPPKLGSRGDEYDSEVVSSRAYRLVVDGVPAFLISEWFLGGVLDAVGKHTSRGRGDNATG